MDLSRQSFNCLMATLFKPNSTSHFLSTLNQYQLSWLVSIRSNHGVWMPSNQRVRANKWSTVPWRLPPGLAVDRLPRCKFTRTFSNQNSETRYIREIIYGKRHHITYWQLTTDTETMPENSTTYVMTNLQKTTKAFSSPHVIR